MHKRQMTINDYMSLPWHYSTEASEWEGEKGYWISVAELPDCSTFASKIEEGLARMPSLLREYLKASLASQANIPMPERSEDLSLAGNLSLRIPISLHMGVKNAAKLQKTSINQFAVKALTEAVTRTAKPFASVDEESIITKGGRAVASNEKAKTKHANRQGLIYKREKYSSKRVAEGR